MNRLIAAMARSSINYSTSSTSTFNINLDSNYGSVTVHGLSRESYGAAGIREIVTGSLAHQSYLSGGLGNESVTMTGGYGLALLGGDSSSLIMGGGNNSASVALGNSAEADQTPNTSLSTYDGGASNPLTGESRNEISFASSASYLNMTINESVSYSSVSAVSWADNSFYDNARFKNFQSIIGSTVGNTIAMRNTDDIYNLSVEGGGANTIFLDNVSELNLGISESGMNNITIINSNSIMITDIEGSSLSEGLSTIYLDANSSKVTMFLNGHDNIIDENIRSSSNEITIALGTTNLSHEFAFLDLAGIHFIDAVDNSDTSQNSHRNLTYSLANPDTNSLYQSSKAVKLLITSGEYSDFYALNQVLDAMDYMQMNSGTYSSACVTQNGVTLYNMNQLVSVIASYEVNFGPSYTYTGAALSSSIGSTPLMTF